MEEFRWLWLVSSSLASVFAHFVVFCSQNEHQELIKGYIPIFIDIVIRYHQLDLITCKLISIVLFQEYEEIICRKFQKVGEIQPTKATVRLEVIKHIQFLSICLNMELKIRQVS